MPGVGTAAPLNMIGKTISRYTLVEKLGAGGMGEVYLATDTELDRRVAIKFLPPGLGVTPDMLERFKREAKAAAALSHPNIITVHDVGTHEGRPYIVMEHVDGEPLSKVIERRTLTVDGAVAIAAQIFEGLSAAHEAGVIHRDVKPDNILVDTTGRVRIVDFGLARLHGAVTVTAEASTVGTIHYMSPEQARGEKLDPRSDLFSAGVVLYEMVAGRRPFEGEHREAVLYAITSVDPKPLSERNKAASEGLERIVTQLLAKDREERHASARQVLEDLHRECGTALSPVSAWSRRGVRLASRRARVAIAATVAAMIAVTAVAVWQQWWPFGGGPALPPGARDWILVADFDSAPADSSVARATKSLLSSALDQSQIVQTVPPDQILQALAVAGKPRTTRVDAQVAKELAYRSSVRSVLEGAVGRIGKGYSIVVNVRDADDAKLILTKSGMAKDDDALIEAIEELAKALRRGLGEQRSALKATRPMALVATPSFDAYKLFVRGQRAYMEQGSNREALHFYRAALAIDPDFASAWLAASIIYQNSGFPDSARVCVDEALRRSVRLSTTQREHIARRRAYLQGDYAAALAALARILAEYPDDWYALGSSNDVLWRLGRYEEALARTRRSMELMPFGPNAVVRANEVNGLIALGRYDEASKANELQTAPMWKIGMRAGIAQAAGQYAVADSIFTAILDDPRHDSPVGGRGGLMSARFARGAVSDATTILRRIDEMSRAANHPLLVEGWRLSQIELSVISDGVVPLPRDPEDADTSTASILNRGLNAAVRQDTALARSCLRSVREHPRRDLVDLAYGPELLDARIETLAGRPENAVRILRPIDGPRLGQVVSLTWVHWWLADAYERTGQADSASVYLERVFSNAFLPDDGAEKPYVHRRLALLFARMGRLVDAERHLASAEKAWDRPDPDVRRMLEEAREAVRYAREMALPDRKRL